MLVQELIDAMLDKIHAVKLTDLLEDLEQEAWFYDYFMLMIIWGQTMIVQDHCFESIEVALNLDPLINPIGRLVQLL